MNENEHVLIDHKALAIGYRIGCILRTMKTKDSPYEAILKGDVLFIKQAPAVKIGSKLSLSLGDK